MVMLSHTPRLGDDRHLGPFDGVADGGQGEGVVLPVQFVVAPDYGRFHPTSLASGKAVMIESGTRIGEVRNGPTRLAVRSPFTGQVDLWLVWDGQVVTPGQALCSLRRAPTISAAGG